MVFAASQADSSEWLKPHSDGPNITLRSLHIRQGSRTAVTSSLLKLLGWTKCTYVPPSNPINQKLNIVSGLQLTGKLNILVVAIIIIVILMH